MNKFYDKFVGGLASGLGILAVIGLTGVAYGAYVAMTDVTTGQTLTASTFNQVLENVRVLRIDVDKSSPAGAIMAFNLSSCPTGWIIANGANGTPDLRGEFIRGLDSGRGVNSGRVLSSYEAATKISTPLYYGTFGGATSFAGLGFWDQDSFTQVNYGGSVITNLGSGAAWTGLSSTAGGEITIRPRNVALLYCVKQ